MHRFVRSSAALSLLVWSVVPSLAASEPAGVKRQKALTPATSTQVEPSPAVTTNSHVLFYAYRVGNYLDSSTATDVAVPLNNAQSTTLSFTTTVKNQVIIINYNAECGALGTPDNDDYLALTIKVDGKNTFPNSTTSFAFCTATSSTAYNWVGASRQAFVRLATPGNHNIQVFGNGEGTSGWWLGDASLVIFNGN